MGLVPTTDQPHHFEKWRGPDPTVPPVRYVSATIPRNIMFVSRFNANHATIHLSMSAFYSGCIKFIYVEQLTTIFLIMVDTFASALHRTFSVSVHPPCCYKLFKLHPPSLTAISATYRKKHAPTIAYSLISTVFHSSLTHRQRAEGTGSFRHMSPIWLRESTKQPITGGALTLA